MKRKIIFVVLISLPLILLAGTWFAGTILTSPSQQSIGPIPPGLNGRVVQFQSSSGAMILGWFVPGKPGAGAIVLMHGVRSNRLSMLERARFLSKAGYSVLLFDFQAHGESSGEHITFGSLESKDAQAAIQFLRETAPGEKIGIIAVSMGGAATILASPPVSVDAVILEMVYPTINEAVNNRLTSRLGSWARVLSPLLLFQLRPRLGIGSNDLRPIDHVGQLRAPKLFIAGANDRSTTLEESQRLYETASAPKDFWVVPGVGHVDAHNRARVEYEQRVLDFFARNLR
jgi:uncharacterized protein